MQRGWSNIWVRIALAWRGLVIDLNNFYLLEHRSVTGQIVSGKNSGTHWLRFMLSHAMAHRHGVPPPQRSSGRLSEDFVGHPAWPRRHPGLPFIGLSHNLPSIAFAWPWLRRLLRLPPVVVLVRDPKEAMLSHFVKWRGPLELSMHDYVHRASTKRRQLANAWWYIDFFNRWGRIAKGAPRDILVVRYEDLEAAPAQWLERISSHLGLGLETADLDAAVAVSSRGALKATLDPGYGEEIVPDAADRAAVRFSTDDERALNAQFKAHLVHDFGYGLATRSNVLARTTRATPAWVRAAFVLAAGFALIEQTGVGYFSIALPGPWDRLELGAAFALLTLLGPASFPRLKALVPPVLSLFGGGVELAQYGRLAPGVGSFGDLFTELAGIGCGMTLMFLVSGARPNRPSAV